MIYASSSRIINSNNMYLWQNIAKFLKIPSQGNYIKNCVILEEYDDGFTRSLAFEGDPIQERIFLIPGINKIVVQLENHPLFIGETIYQIITSTNPELSEQKATLCVLIARRLRPGLIEAPNSNYQIVIEDICGSIKTFTETSSGLI